MDAHLVAQQWLNEAEPEQEPPRPEPEPTPPPSPKDFILDTDTVLGGVVEPSYYDGLLAQLKGKGKVKLTYQTFLIHHPNGNISLRLHVTDIITVQPNGLAIISSYGAPNPEHMEHAVHGFRARGYGTAPRSWRTAFTRNKLNDYLPCGWRIYSQGKSGMPSPTRGPEGKRGAENWWWANKHSRSGYYDGPGVRLPFSDLDQIDTHTGKLKPRLAPVPISGRGSNPERTSGYGVEGHFFEAKKLAPNWTETSGIFADYSDYPKIEFYAKCPKCGHVHGNYKSMREAHAKRLCQLCNIETVNKIKEVVAHVDDPGMTPKSISRIVGEAFDAKSHILQNVDPEWDWVYWAKDALSKHENADLEFVDESVADVDPDNVTEFELEDGNIRYSVYKNSDEADKKAIERVEQQLKDEPELFTQSWLINYVDEDRLKRDLTMDFQSVIDDESTSDAISRLISSGFLEEDDFYTATGKFRKITPKLQRLLDAAIDKFKEQEIENFDPKEWLQDIYGKEEWIKQAFEIAPLVGTKLEEAAKDAVNTDGWAHFLSSYTDTVIDLDNGVVAIRTQ